MSVRLTTEEFIARSRKVHGDLFDYSKTVYVDAKKKVEIGCRVHNTSFWQAPASHMNGMGCPYCGYSHVGKINRGSSKSFADKASEKFQDRFDYSKVVYKTQSEKVEIICNVHHHSFWITPQNHLRSREGGCPECWRGLKLDDESIIARFREVHGDRYDYSRVHYVGPRSPVIILCREHSPFSQLINDHLSGQGCPICGGTAQLTTEDFVNRSRAVHGDKYDYSRVKYSSAHEKVEIVCIKHQLPFWQEAQSHYLGCGCPECAKEQWASGGEQFIADWLREKGFNVIQMYRGHGLKLPGGSGPFEIDVFLPDLNVGFEYNSCIYHSCVDTPMSPAKPANYHRDKTITCLSGGIRLFHIWEDIPHPVVEGILSAKLGLGTRYAARKTKVVYPSHQQAQDFYSMCHRQRESSAGLFNIGLVSKDGELLSCMQWRRHSEGVELSRYAGKPGVQVIGGMSKLLKHSMPDLKAQGFNNIVSYCDRDLSPVWQDTMYAKSGFNFEGEISTQLWYFVSKKFGKFAVGLHNRRNFQKPVLCSYWPEQFDGWGQDGKPSLVKDPDGNLLPYGAVTEMDICKWNGIYAIRTSGMWKFTLPIV